MTKHATNLLLFIFGVLAGVAIAGASAQSVWLSPGAVSWHQDRTAGYNERNAGLGVEWQSATTEHRLSAGYYRNSIHGTSRYATYAWVPLRTEIGAVKLGLGVTAGIVDGYQANGGRIIPAVLPVATIDIWRIGINITAWPSISSKHSAGVAAQVRLAVW